MSSGLIERPSTTEAPAQTTTPKAPEPTTTPDTPPSTTASKSMQTPESLATIVYPRSRRPRALDEWWGGRRNDGARNVTIAAMAGLLVLAALTAALISVGVMGSRTVQTYVPQTPQTVRSGPQAAVPAHHTYDPGVPAAASGDTVNVKLVAQEAFISVAPKVGYHAWTFNGTVPGPVLHVRQGQTVNFTLVNNTPMPHSIDFHAAETPWNVNYQAVMPGKSFSFSWQAMLPGVYMYHCGTPPVLEHIANGMFGMIIVDPPSGWVPATEYAVVQSEFYTQMNADGSYSYNDAKAMSEQPDYVVFNGYANQYKDAPLTVKAGQRMRLFVLNAGPSQFSAFHVIGAMFDDVYVDGVPANHMVGNQTITIAPGDTAVIEMVIPQPGLYPFVTHSFADASKGAVGVIKVTP